MTIFSFEFVTTGGKQVKSLKAASLWGNIPQNLDLRKRIEKFLFAFLMMIATLLMIFLLSFPSWGKMHAPLLRQHSGSIAYLVYEKIDFNVPGDIFIFDLPSGACKKLTEKPLPIYWRLDWSLDGRKLAFCLNNDGILDIYVMDTDGQNVTPVTKNGISYDPAWSPDGKKIAYAVSQKAGAPQIYVMNADGTNPQNLTNDDSTNNGFPDWSPDGSQIVFWSQPVGGGGRKSEIYLMDASGKNRRRLAGTEHIDWEPAWSPDGQNILFSSADGHIYMVDANGKNLTRLTHVGVNSSPVWSPDGQEIAFVSTKDGQSDIYLMNVDGNDVRKLTNDSKRKIGLSWTAKRVLTMPQKGNLIQTWGWIKSK